MNNEKKFLIFNNDTGILCHYGCGCIAKYAKTIKNNKKIRYCCSEHFMGCSAMKLKNSNGQTKINPETGNRFSYERNIRTRDNLKNKIDSETGLPHYENVGAKIKKTLQDNPSILTRRAKKFLRLANAIDKESGLKNSKLWSRISQENFRALPIEEQEEKNRKKVEKIKNTLENSYSEYNGELLSHKEIRNRKTKKSLFEIVGEDGLTSYERSQKRYNKLLPYKNTNILYNSNEEYYFLEQTEFDYGSLKRLEEIISRPRPIKYHDPFLKKTRIYYPDFLLNQNAHKTLYEIKSRWTYDKNGNDLELRVRNAIKLSTAKKELNCDCAFFIIDGYMYKCQEETIEELKIKKQEIESQYKEDHRAFLMLVKNKDLLNNKINFNSEKVKITIDKIVKNLRSQRIKKRTDV